MSMGRLAAFLEMLPRGLVVALCLVLVAGVGVLDVVTGPKYVLSVVYAAPVSIAAWTLGRRAGLLFALLATLVWTAADRSGLAESWATPVLWWNAAVYLAFFAVVVYILSALRQALAEEQLLARVDPLTHVANVRQFRERAEAELSRARRSGRPVSVVVFDVDDLKAVNDRYGHPAGDALLVAVADSWAHSLRVSDVIARLGGDEFAVLLPDTPEGAAVAAVEKCREISLAALAAGGWESSLSIGVYTWSGGDDDVEALLRFADALMYDVKLSGKDGVRSATQEHVRPGANGPVRSDGDRIVAHE